MKAMFIFFMLMIGSFTNAQVFFQAPYATSITATTATLNVYMNLSNTYQVGYQISTDSNFAGATIQGQTNTFAGTYNLTNPVTGLIQNTTYYIRYRALSGGNSTYSPEGSFTTQVLAPVVYFAPANVTTNSATINYTINANGYNTTSVIKYGFTPDAMTNQATGFSATGTTDTSNSATITGLDTNTQYYFIIEATNSYGTSSSFIGTFTTSSFTPVISSISTPVTTNSATINYSVNAGGGNTTSVVKYGLSSSAMTNDLTGFSVTGNTSASGNVPIVGLTPNTQYFYKIEATNSYGTTSSAIGSFTTNPVIINQMITEYQFDGTYNNVNGNTPFASNTGTSFTTDRRGIANKALNLQHKGTTATILNLPYGTQSRTVSLWVKLNALGVWNFLYSYGTATNPEGAHINATTATHFVPGNQFATTHSIETWYHYAFTFDGTSSRIYRNGTLVKTLAVSKSTENNNNIFRLGLSEGGAENVFNGAVDDLQIYNYALSDSQIADLYSTQTLAVNDSSGKNSQVQVFPNPVRDILNIKSYSAIQQVEIWSVDGKRIKQTNQSRIDVSQLPSGVYIIKTMNDKGNIETQKFIKN